jgi:hypothetical protein
MVSAYRAAAPPSCGPDRPPPSVVVEGYRRLAPDRRLTSASALAERRRLATWTEHRGWRLATIVEERKSPNDGVLGDGLRSAVSRVESRDCDGLVVPSLAHLATWPQGALCVIELILAAGGVFASVDECFDVSTVSGRRRYLRLCQMQSLSPLSPRKRLTR